MVCVLTGDCGLGLIGLPTCLGVEGGDDALQRVIDDAGVPEGSILVVSETYGCTPSCNAGVCTGCKPGEATVAAGR